MTTTEQKEAEAFLDNFIVTLQGISIFLDSVQKTLNILNEKLDQILLALMDENQVPRA